MIFIKAYVNERVIFVIKSIPYDEFCGDLGESNDVISFAHIIETFISFRV